MVMAFPTHGKPPTDNGANGDPDQDGVPNHEELFYGSDPHNLRDPDANTSHTWKPRPEKIQLMVVNCHADDEGIFFGGLIPYYTQVREIPTINICMATANSSSTREREFRNYQHALDMAGLRLAGLG